VREGLILVGSVLVQFGSRCTVSVLVRGSLEEGREPDRTELRQPYSEGAGEGRGR
jgi:hypothetical protein